MNFTTFIFNAGERYDFVVHANQKPKDYQIQAIGHGPCFNRSIKTNAILSYKLTNKKTIVAKNEFNFMTNITKINNQQTNDRVSNYLFYIMY